MTEPRKCPECGAEMVNSAPSFGHYQLVCPRCPVTLESRKCPEPGCGLQMYVKRSHWDAKTQTYDLVEWECPRERFQCDPHELAALRARNAELEAEVAEEREAYNRWYGTADEDGSPASFDELRAQLDEAHKREVVLTEALEKLSREIPRELYYGVDRQDQDGDEALSPVLLLEEINQRRDLASQALSNTSALAAQRKREIQREAVEAAWHRIEPQFPNHPQTDQLRAAILGTTEP